MKKIILTTIFLLSVLYSFAQRHYYAYGTAREVKGYNVVGYHFTPVVDLTRLDASGISMQGQYGKRPILEYYQDVLMKWLKKVLLDNGISPSDCDLSGSIITTNQYQQNCADYSCLVTNRAEKEKDRQEQMNSDRSNRDQPAKVDELILH